MRVLTLPFRLPLLPVHAVVRLAQLLQEEAERELADPATIRRELERIEQAQASGEISDQTAARLEREAVADYTQVTRAATVTADGDEG